jgi:hypothetical protein
MTRWRPQNSCCWAENDERVLAITVSKRKGCENLAMGKHISLPKAQRVWETNFRWDREFQGVAEPTVQFPLC